MASASDNFNRANGAIGANWTQVSGAWTVATNAANQTTTGGQYRTAVYTATPPATNDYTVSANVRNNDNAVGVGVVARASSSAVTCYLLVGFAGDSFYLVRLAAGVENVLATMSGMTSGVTYLVELEVNGTTVRGRIDGGAWTSVTDSNLASGGWGLGSYGAITGGSRWIDDFGAADSSSGTTYTETGATTFGGSASGVGAFTAVAAGAAVWGGSASGVGFIGFAETGAAVAGWVASGGDSAAWVDAGAGVWGQLAAGSDLFTTVDVGGAVWSGVASGADAIQAVDVGAGVFGWVASGADSYVPVGGATYDETGAAVYGWLASGADILTMADGGHVAGAWVASGPGVCVWVVGGGAVAPWASGAQERQTMSDDGAGVWSGMATGGDVETMVAAGPGVWGNAASGTDGVGGGEPAPFPFVVRDGGRRVDQNGNTARDGGRQVDQRGNTARDGSRKTR